MDLDEIFPSQYLKASDIQKMPNGRCQLVIASTEPIQFKKKDGSPDPKVLIGLQGAQKKFVSNKTNCNRIAHHYGRKPNEWVGKPIVLYVAEIEAFGDIVDAIKVHVPTTTTALPEAEQAPAAPEEYELPATPDDGIPF